jgi:hypothetical protein
MGRAIYLLHLWAFAACFRVNFTFTFTFYMMSYNRWQMTARGTDVQTAKRKSKAMEKVEGVFLGLCLR